MLIVLEGIDGCGKTTQAHLLIDRLQASGYSTMRTWEPGDTPLGAVIRHRLLHGEAVSDEAALFLFLADRAQHVKYVILPNIADDVIVCERFTGSTIAYQGYGGNLPLFYSLDRLRTFCEVASAGLVPTLTILLDVPVSIAFARLGREQREQDTYERRGSAFLERVRSGYLQIAASQPLTWITVDGTQPVAWVQAEIWQRLQRVVEAPRHWEGVWNDDHL